MKDVRVYLAQMLEAVERIETYSRVGRDGFLQSELHQDAVVRNFEIIGEAAKRVPDDYRAAHPEIPWRSMTAFRDVLAHDYESVEQNRVWLVIERDLPGLKAALLAVLPPLDQLEAELAGDGDA
jgi:uncharacterized protein with HEPN domain